MQVAEQLRSLLSGRYAIEREIGAGGMATVYLAIDEKHHRKVAVKVLHPDLAAALGVERFLAEIRTTANLQHPHILPLHDSGEAGGFLFYVMPYIDGESLRDRLLREKLLPIADAVRIAKQVASALDYAHRHGVIHRDIKPENILLHDESALVADFGIALALQSAGGPRLTQTGLSLGTPHYMSPEQATGGRVDARTDLYSLGAVTYEMLAGDPPHTGSTVQALIAKVLTERPQSLRVTRGTVPEALDAAVQRALAKLPADRFRTAGEFADALTFAPVNVPTDDPGAALASPGTRRRSWKPIVQGTPPALAVALAMWMLIGGSAPDPEPVQLEVTFAESIEYRSRVSLSRDGSLLAFRGRGPAGNGIYVRRMNGMEAEFVRGTERGSRPRFSPNGQWLLFDADRQVRKVLVSGGTPITVVDSLDLASASYAEWVDDERVVFAHTSGGLWLVSADGGRETLLAPPDSARGHLEYRGVHVLPGAKAALVAFLKGSRDEGSYQLGVVTIPGGVVTELGIAGTDPWYAASGHLLYGGVEGGRVTGTLMAAPFQLRNLRASGQGVPVLEGVLFDPHDYALADNGTLIFVHGDSLRSVLTVVNRRGEARPLTDQHRNYGNPRLSPDGRLVALDIRWPSDIWTVELETGNFTRITTSGTAERPEWTPAGDRIVYHSREGNNTVLRVQPSDRSGSSELMLKHPDRINEFSFGAPGTYVAFRTPQRDVWVAPMDSLHAARPFLNTRAVERQARVSPDGKLIAYVSEETGRPEVYVRPLPGPGRMVKVSFAGGAEPLWSGSGRELFYRAPGPAYRAPGFMMAATIERSPELNVTRRDSLFRDTYITTVNHWNYDVFADGQQFLMVQSAVAPPRPFAIVNWTTELKRKVPGSPTILARLQPNR